MKKFICLLCVTVLFAVAFSGCNIIEKFVETNASTTALTAEKTTEEATEVLTQEETTMPSSSEYLNIADGDIELLRSLLSLYSYSNYDAKAATAADFMKLMTDGQVCWGVINTANVLCSNGYFPDEAYSHGAVDTGDPLGLFPYAAVWVREDMFDFISRDMYGIEIPHEFDEQSETNQTYYYHDGYFYFSCIITGFEADDILIQDIERQEDNRYLVKTEHVYGNVDMGISIEHNIYGDVLAGVVEKDGRRYWEISKITVY